MLVDIDRIVLFVYDVCFLINLSMVLTVNSEQFNLIHDLTQAGFREHFSTVNNIFILKSLIDIVKTSKNNINVTKTKIIIFGKNNTRNVIPW